MGYNTLADTLPEGKAELLGDTLGNKLGNGEAAALLDTLDDTLTWMEMKTLGDT